MAYVLRRPDGESTHLIWSWIAFGRSMLLGWVISCLLSGPVVGDSLQHAWAVWRR